MMGPRQVDQAALFYEFSLERHVPATHLLRSIDRFVDLSEIRSHLAPFYSSTGRPSIDPELLVRMLLVGYCYGIRSERRLCEEVHLNLAYRWFCRLGLDGEVPDHSQDYTFSTNTLYNVRLQVGLGDSINGTGTDSLFAFIDPSFTIDGPNSGAYSIFFRTGLVVLALPPSPNPPHGR